VRPILVTLHVLLSSPQRCDTLRVQGSVIGWLVTFICRWVIACLLGAHLVACVGLHPDSAHGPFVGVRDFHCTLMCVSMWAWLCVWAHVMALQRQRVESCCCRCGLVEHGYCIGDILVAMGT
jgi:hypothetical protein